MHNPHGGIKVLLLLFYAYTYSSPDSHIEPMLDFMHRLCALASSKALPISLSWNYTPRESFFNEASWERFRRRVRAGRISKCHISQYVSEGMTMHSFLPQDRPLPLRICAEFVPSTGVPNDRKHAVFGLVVKQGISRYPTNIAVTMPVEEYGLQNHTGQSFLVEGLERELVATTRAVYACNALQPWTYYREPEIIRTSPMLFDDVFLVENMDSRIPKIVWGMFLGSKHIERLGGKERVLGELADCRVDDLSTETEERLYIQLTQNIEDFDESVADKYHPFFEPLLKRE